jgi:hypothetical protein
MQNNDTPCDDKALDEYLLKFIKKLARDGFKLGSAFPAISIRDFVDIFLVDKEVALSNLVNQYRLLAEKVHEKNVPLEQNDLNDFESESYQASGREDNCYILPKRKINGKNKLRLACLSKSKENLYIEHVTWMLLHIEGVCEQLNISFSSLFQEFGPNMEDWNLYNGPSFEYVLEQIIGNNCLSKLDRVKLKDYVLCGEIWIPGAFGAVCLAKDRSDNFVALKKISHSKHGFLRELESVLFYKDNFNDHPNLIKILSVGVDEDVISDNLALPVLFYTMEVADNINENIAADTCYSGMTLNNVINLIDRIKAQDLSIILEQLLNGVKFLHDKGAAHRDIKPDNILFVDGIPKLADVGLVSSYEATMSLAGTPGFLPQEYMEKVAHLESPDQRMDLYALGMTAYCAFTGFSPEKYPEVPFELLKTSEDRRMNKIILKACAQEPTERFQTADEFIAALEI